MKIKVIEDFLNDWKERVKKWAFEQKQKLRELSYNASDAWNNGRFAEYREFDDKKRALKSQLPKWVYRLDNNGIERMLAHDVEIKYNILIARMNKVIGNIKNASYLEVGLNGELNGVVEGENGRARIETIGAGGYNIQCYHYRVLIHRIGDK